MNVRDCYCQIHDNNAECKFKKTTSIHNVAYQEWPTMFFDCLHRWCPTGSCHSAPTNPSLGRHRWQWTTYATSAISVSTCTAPWLATIDRSTAPVNSGANRSLRAAHGNYPISRSRAITQAATGRISRPPVYIHMNNGSIWRSMVPYTSLIRTAVHTWRLRWPNCNRWSCVHTMCRLKSVVASIEIATYNWRNIWFFVLQFTVKLVLFNYNDSLFCIAFCKICLLCYC